MNEEQKEFINKLLKDANAGASLHGLIVNDINMGEIAQKTIKETNLKDLDYKAIVHDYISPSNSKTKNKILDMLLDIKENNDFTQYNNWVKENEKRGSFNKPHNPNYTNRLVDVVRWIINYNDLNKIMAGCIVSDKIVLKEKPLTTDDLKTTKNEDNSSTIDEEKSSENDEKSFKPDEEILIENVEKSSTIDDQKSLKLPKLKNTKKKDSDKEETISISKIDTIPETETEAKSTPAETATVQESETVPLSPVVEDSSLEGKEKQLFKNIELALSYKNNKEYQDNNVLEFKHKNGKIYEPEKPSEKLKALVHQQIADYIKELHNKYGYNLSEFIKLKQEIIDKINERYFGDNNEYGFRVYNKKSNTASIEIKDLKDSKQKRRVKKNYVNQNAPNKFSFFVYNMKDIYSIIEEYFEISLSIHSKTLIESIIRTSVDKYVRIANKSGQISYHTISHGAYATGASLHDMEAMPAKATDTIIKLIEKYINSKRNIHIKSKFEFDSDSRSKLMEIINKEINRNKNDFKQKSKNIISFIDHLKFF